MISKTKGNHSQQRQLSSAKKVSLMKQAITVVCYLHIVPKLCHRDIKPENAVTSETDAELILKLVWISTWRLCRTLSLV